MATNWYFGLDGNVDEMGCGVVLGVAGLAARGMARTFSLLVVSMTVSTPPDSSET